MMQMQQQQHQQQMQQQHQLHLQQQQQNPRQPPPKYNDQMMPHQVRNPSVPNYMMNQMGQHMGPGPPGAMRFGGPVGPNGPQMANAPRGMGPRGQGFQSIPPSGPMMRQQAAGPPNMMGNGPGPGDMQRMRLPNHMMGPGVGGPIPNGPQKVPVSHPSPQHGPASGSPAGMWANMGSGSPNPNGMPIQQQQSIGSPRTPGDQNHGSPMMQQNMRSQTPGMNPVPNSQQGMGQPRMVGPQGNMGPMNPRMSMMNPQHQNMMHQMHPGQQPGPPPPGQGGPQGPGGNPPGQSSPARGSPMSHASPMGVNHGSPHPHMQPHMASPNMQHMMNQQQPPQQHPAKNDDYNLDFLDSIDSGAPNSGDGPPGGAPSENSGPPGSGPGGGPGGASGNGGGPGGQNHHRTQAQNAQQLPPGAPQPSQPSQPSGGNPGPGGPNAGDPEDFMNLLDS